MPSSEYVHQPTADPRIFALHKRGDEPSVLTPQDLTLINRMKTPAWRKRLALLRKTDAESKDTAYRQQLLKLLHQLSTPLPGFIVTYGKRTLRVLFVRDEPQWEVTDMPTLIECLGEQLPAVADTVTVRLSSETYLRLVDQSIEPRMIVSAELNIDRIRERVRQGAVELPEGVLTLGDPKEPTIRIQLVKDTPERR